MKTVNLSAPKFKKHYDIKIVNNKVIKKTPKPILFLANLKQIRTIKLHSKRNNIISLSNNKLEPIK